MLQIAAIEAEGVLGSALRIYEVSATATKGSLRLFRIGAYGMLQGDGLRIYGIGATGTQPHDRPLVYQDGQWHTARAICWMDGEWLSL